MEESKKLKLKRGLLRSKISKIERYLKENIAEVEYDNVAIKEAYDGVLEGLLVCNQSFNEVQDSLAEFVNDAEPDQVLEYEKFSIEFDERFYACKTLLTRYIGRFKFVGGVPQGNVADETMFAKFIEQQTLLITELTRRAPGNVPEVQVGQMKLSPLKIPNFCGDYKDWISFYDMFNAAIHTNERLSNAQKLQYLKEALTGPAAQLIRHITISDANYAEAYDLLVKRYNKRKHVVTALIRTVMEHSPVVNSSLSQIRSLVNTTNEVTRSLKALGAEFETRDPWIMYILLEKLDTETKKCWSQKVVESDEDLSLDDFVMFVENRCDALESCGDQDVKQKSKISSTRSSVSALHSSTPREESSASTSGKSRNPREGEERKCNLCSEKHDLFACPKFRRLTVSSRRDFVSNNQICKICLQSTHPRKTCSPRFTCKKCADKHHFLLHIQPEDSGSTSTSISQIPPATNSLVSCFNSGGNQQLKLTKGILPTAIINVKDKYGNDQQVRMLLDTASDMSLISEECMQRLNIPRQNARIQVSGIAESEAGITRGNASLKLSSRFNSTPILELNVLIMKKLTKPVPSHEFQYEHWNLIKNLQLADPRFDKASNVDIIVGAQHCMTILGGSKINDANGRTIAIESIFGWLICGEIPVTVNVQTNIISLQTSINIDESIRKLWEIEEINKEPPLTDEEKFCEEHYEENVQRDDSGRYVVKLPFRSETSDLGESSHAAIVRLKAMERKFLRDVEFKRQYDEFMEEYLKLGHMERIPENQIKLSPKDHFYLPHHAVLKEDSSTTKLRVVFDGSSQTDSGMSLNSKLCVGPTLQNDLFSTVLRFRTHEIALTSDIQKMYRQIKIHPDDTDFQRIVWRNNSNEPIQHFRLNTVTYGTSSAPYLAIKTLQQLAKDYEKMFPEASSIIKRDFYVDDLLTGCGSADNAVELQQQLSHILLEGGFPLRKWASNCPEVLKNVPEEHRETGYLQINVESKSLKTLGNYWHPLTDIFSFQVKVPLSGKITKRQILSDASRLFDPFGWVAPCVIRVKILFQQLWLLKLSWDEVVPQDIADIWIELRDELPLLEKVSLPRWLPNHSGVMELHGFSDASESAYAAVVYARAIVHGITDVVLIASKTKVAPVNQLSVPRLELCAALLLARLMDKIKQSSPHLNFELFAWSDSTIVLGWLKDHPRKWKTFVGNRTSEILTIFPNVAWRHVPTSHNPADCASRGMSPEQLLSHDLWWSGPAWLSKGSCDWPQQKCYGKVIKELPERREIQVHVVTAEAVDDSIPLLLERYSSLFKMLRMTVWCLRLSAKLRKIPTETGVIKTSEIQFAKNMYIKWAQQVNFQHEIQRLKSNKLISVRSSLIKLHPFLDDIGILRVGGRLENLNSSFNSKHPIILPGKNRFSKLLISDMHISLLHAGPTLLTNSIRQNYWIIGQRSIIKDTVHKCLRCCRQQAGLSKQLMGNLPEVRITPARPFLKSGVDFCGPISLKRNKGRGGVIDKGYIAVFICMATKAVHLEIVSDLSSDAFLASLKRFNARRGYCSDIYSDNGTNFVGARSKLDEIQKIITSHKFNEIVSQFTVSIGTNWHFNPPSAPHFGGIFEAAVKSVKFHMKRVIFTCTLTFEEMTTVITQIEAVLNSRPLCALTDDVQSCEALTPSHFLIGEPLITIPEPNISHQNVNRLTRWKLVQKLYTDFWERWRKEYISTLQQRTKWTKPEDNIQIGDLVLIKDENLPPSHWALARVTNTHPGKDGLVRVVSLRSKDKNLQRPIHKLCKLPNA